MMTTIPDFTEKGYLPKGTHLCSAQQFIERFCMVNEKRQALRKAFIDILDFANARNALCVLVGGSYVTDKKDPHDLDVVIVLRSKDHIPTRPERLLLEGKRTDIMFCSADDPILTASFLKLLSYERFGSGVGVIQISLNHPDEPWTTQHEPDDDTYEVIKRAYFNRHLVDLNEAPGVLVTIHGLMTHAEWNANLIPIASSQGWVVAPYIYGYTTPDILLNKGKRKEAVDAFREWIYSVQRDYCQNGEQISIIAHSFGTYLIGAYLDGFEEYTPVNFNTIILTGSILNENYDWESCVGNKVARVRNEIAPNDQWVSWIPRKPAEWMGLDPLFGQAGTNGFTSASHIITQPSNKIFDHNNVIKKDVITSMWMPFLNSNKHASEEEWFKRRHINE
ncbi:DUF6932 family protein [Citrobacter freundii]|uniref:DUF6932 family protein n=1 Tax=Citrobacter freundii TaxID=546 RepID=UPI001D1C4DD6|nr:hypothetical protein [Citrobacter freundii]CAE7288866.1 hypothetical protein AI2609V1_2328 [Citrobacter freundii]CAH3609541.1 hypothetical protein AI2609V1_2328 [Citrobacter freundii]